MPNKTGMDKELKGLGKPERVLIASIAAIIIFVGAIVLLTRPAQAPQTVAKRYVRLLADGRCKPAYAMISPYAKSYYPDCRDYDTYKQNVCESIEDKYEMLALEEIRNVEQGESRARIYFVVRYKTRWRPRRQYSDVHMEMVRKGRKWLIEGPYFGF